MGAQRAARATARLLRRFREHEQPIVHVRQFGTEGSFLRAGTPGVDIHPLAAPLAGEPVVEKLYANAFRETELKQVLRTRGPRRLVVAGMMTSMCVDATVRAALDLGYEVSLATDAMAAPDLTIGEQTIDGRSVHLAFAAALRDAGAKPVTSSGALPLDRRRRGSAAPGHHSPRVRRVSERNPAALGAQRASRGSEPERLDPIPPILDRGDEIT